MLKKIPSQRLVLDHDSHADCPMIELSTPRWESISSMVARVWCRYWTGHTSRQCNLLVQSLQPAKLLIILVSVSCDVFLFLFMSTAIRMSLLVVVIVFWLSAHTSLFSQYFMFFWTCSTGSTDTTPLHQSLLHSWLVSFLRSFPKLRKIFYWLTI